MLKEGLRRYKSWSEGVEKATARVAVLYASDYGFSDRLSQTLARGITKAGVAVEMLDILSADPQVRPFPLFVHLHNFVMPKVQLPNFGCVHDVVRS